METTTYELKTVAEHLAYEDDTAYYHGAYNGRWYHRGFAIVFDPNYTKTLCDLLNDYNVDLGEPDQKDNMGMQVVWSWDIKHFTDLDNPEKGKYDEEFDED